MHESKSETRETTAENRRKGTCTPSPGRLSLRPESAVLACLAFDVLAEIPVIMNYGDRLDHVRAKQLMNCLMTIGNRGMALT